jgi:hypothetical protein
MDFLVDGGRRHLSKRKPLFIQGVISLNDVEHLTALAFPTEINLFKNYQHLAQLATRAGLIALNRRVAPYFS